MGALDKLGNLLCDCGLAVADEDFQIAKGYWTHTHQDVIRWEGGFRMAGASLSDPAIVIDSWDSVSECAKHGFWLVKGGAAYGDYQAVAKKPGTTEPNDVVTIEDFKRQHSSGLPTKGCNTGI
jgi:hypothetical protein